MENNINDKNNLLILSNFLYILNIIVSNVFIGTPNTSFISDCLYLKCLLDFIKIYLYTELDFINNKIKKEYSIKNINIDGKE